MVCERGAVEQKFNKTFVSTKVCYNQYDVNRILKFGLQKEKKLCVNE